MKLLTQWIKDNSVMLFNAGSLIGATAITSILGFVYWWLAVATKQFPPEAIGIASASISSMMLLGSLCVLGLGTLLITELPRQQGQEISLISTALIVVSIAGGSAGILFALIAPSLSPAFMPLRANIVTILIFASGVSITSVTLVFDQALIGLLRGGLQLWRNTLFAILKLVALLIVSFSLVKAGHSGITLYATWVAGGVLSLLLVVIPSSLKKRRVKRSNLPQWGLLRKLGVAAVQHHFLNITLQFPTLMLPVLVTALLSARVNGWFYVAWMIGSFVFLVSSALTTVLHAMNSAQQDALYRRARTTISIALVVSVLANIPLQFATKQILGIFSSTYAYQASWCLRILAMAAFPITIRNHYISICRIQDRIVSAMISMIPGGLFELVSAGIGAYFGGLTGLSIGWVAAIYCEAIFMLPTVYKAFSHIETPVLTIDLEFKEPLPITLMTTLPLPAISIFLSPFPLSYSKVGRLKMKSSYLEPYTPQESRQATSYEHLTTQSWQTAKEERLSVLRKSKVGRLKMKPPNLEPYMRLQLKEGK